jgi:UDP:flavonoid glycosyltransferase YjiC (YdhE family)
MHFITQDLEIIKSLKLDIVIADHRRSALVAADINKIHNISITQASSLGSKCKLSISAIDYGRMFLGKNFITEAELKEPRPIYLEDKPLPSEFISFQQKYNIRIKRNFSDLSLGRHTFITDTPSIFPVQAPGWNVSQIGPMLPTSEKHLSFTSFNKEGRKTILLYMGSTGDDSLIDMLIKSLNEEIKYNIVIVGNSKGHSPQVPNIRYYDWVDFHHLFQNIDIQICHGGSINLYFSILYSVPSLSIPHNMDQKINAIAFSSLEGISYLTKEEFYQRPYYIQKLVRELLGERGMNPLISHHDLLATEHAIESYCKGINFRK